MDFNPGLTHFGQNVYLAQPGFNTGLTQVKPGGWVKFANPALRVQNIGNTIYFSVSLSDSAFLTVIGPD